MGRRSGELRGAASDGVALSPRGERGRADDGGPSSERVRAVRSHRGREDRPPGRCVFGSWMTDRATLRVRVLRAERGRGAGARDADQAGEVEGERVVREEGEGRGGATQQAQRRLRAVASSQQPSRHLWLGNVNCRAVTVAQLRALFEPFGAIENINILSEKNCVFVDYFEEASAVAAQRQMRGVMLGGHLIELGFGKYEEKPAVLTQEDANTVLVAFAGGSGGDVRASGDDHAALSRATDAAGGLFANHGVARAARSQARGKCARGKAGDRAQSGGGASGAADDGGDVRGAGGWWVSMEMLSVAAQHQLFFSNNAFPVKAMPDYETCIDLLEDLLLSPLRLLKWPSGGVEEVSWLECQQRDVYLINLTKQCIVQHGSSVPVDEIATCIITQLFSSSLSPRGVTPRNKPLNMQAFECFLAAYSSLFDYKNGSVNIKA